MRMTDLRAGWAIVGNDGQRFGTVVSVSQNYVVATRPGFSGHHYVPASRIANVDQLVVYLNLTKREADLMGWEQPPRDADTLETTPESDLHRHI